MKTPGEYLLELDTGVSGDSFPVVKDVYDNALLLAMRSFYGQRCGCDVNLGGGYAHPKCHLDAAFHASSGKTGGCHISGGWHDAGDCGRFMINSGITTETLRKYRCAMARFAVEWTKCQSCGPDYQGIAAPGAHADVRRR